MVLVFEGEISENNWQEKVWNLVDTVKGLELYLELFFGKLILKLLPEMPINHRWCIKRVKIRKNQERRKRDNQDFIPRLVLLCINPLNLLDNRLFLAFFCLPPLVNCDPFFLFHPFIFIKI